MPSVFKPSGRTKYRFEYRDAAGQLRTHATGVSDKRAAEQIMRDVVRRVEREKAGLPIAQAEMRQAPVASLIQAYADDLARQSRSAIHIKTMRQHLARIFERMAWPNLAAIRLEPFAAFLSALNRAPATQNRYRQALYAFCQFCCFRGWSEENPLKHFKPTKLKKVRLRRAYTLGEFAQMCQTPARGLLYKAAGLSGFRRGELAAMEKQDLNPYATQPLWSPRPEITKARRRDQVPILPDLLPDIRALWDSLPSPESRLFPSVPNYTTLYRDQERAGIARQDAQGRYIDFHSFRYYFCTMLARTFPIHKVQRFMRHADVRMTSAVYMDLGLEDLWADQDQALPSFMPAEPAHVLPMIAV